MPNGHDGIVNSCRNLHNSALGTVIKCLCLLHGLCLNAEAETPKFSRYREQTRHKLWVIFSVAYTEDSIGRFYSSSKGKAEELQKTQAIASQSNAIYKNSPLRTLVISSEKLFPGRLYFAKAFNWFFSSHIRLRICGFPHSMRCAIISVFINRTKKKLSNRWISRKCIPLRSPNPRGRQKNHSFQLGEKVGCFVWNEKMTHLGIHIDDVILPSISSTIMHDGDYPHPS